MIVNELKSSDGSIKRVHRLCDGELVESVILTHKSKKNVCVSSQAGCRMGCRFCASGKRFGRNLTAGEMLEQAEDNIGSVVFMGMGEPLDNPDLPEAIELLKKEKGIPSRKIVVSTVGLVDRMDLLLPTKVNIAISLHATTQEQREKIIPIARKYTLGMLKEKMRELDEKLPRSRKLQIEYALIKGFNDSPDDARRLGGLVPKRSLINVIPVNDIGAGFESPSHDEAWAFKELVRKEGFICYVREPKGRDIAAACGMLAGKKS